jgi:hypothetical protein
MQFRAPVLWVELNNAAPYSATWISAATGERYHAVDSDAMPDLAGVAKASAACAERLDSPGGVVDALARARRALEEGVPAVLECAIDPWDGAEGFVEFHRDVWGLSLSATAGVRCAGFARATERESAGADRHRAVARGRAPRVARALPRAGGRRLEGGRRARGGESRGRAGRGAHGSRAAARRPGGHPLPQLPRVDARRLRAHLARRGLGHGLPLSPVSKRGGAMNPRVPTNQARLERDRRDVVAFLIRAFADEDPADAAERCMARPPRTTTPERRTAPRRSSSWRGRW